MRLSFLLGVFAINGVGFAQVLNPPVVLNSSTMSYSAAGPNQSPEARVFANEPDTWQIDISAFSSPVNLTVFVSDWFPAVPDDYDVFANNSLLGNSWTGSAGTGNTWTFSATTGLQLIRIEYVNRFSGIPTQAEGSWYNFSVMANPVPEPATLMIIGFGSALVLRKRR